MRFVIITGLSGAGKSEAVRVMEDLGFFCIDNLPPALIPKLAELCHENKKVEKVALVIDIRGGKFFDDLFNSLGFLQEMNLSYEILFLEAQDKVLIKRFKESRRKHPLAHEGRIIKGINEERKRLSDLRKMAKYIIDTSNLTPRQLKDEIIKIFSEGKEFKGLVINIISFGFKYGIPLDADLVFDVRFLPNPFYIENLRSLPGTNTSVKDYVMKWDETRVFLEKLTDLIEFLIPCYIKEGKSQLVIGIGCTGGKHRSVVIANELYEYLKDKEYMVIIDHRDMMEE